MRLIDADKLLKDLFFLYDDNGFVKNEESRKILTTICEEPTAYEVNKVVDQIKTLSPANYVSKDDVLKIVKCDNFSPKSEKNSFFNFDEVLQIEAYHK